MNDLQTLDRPPTAVAAPAPEHRRGDALLLDRAFELAFFILPDRHKAWRIALEALDKLDLVATAQDKRRYYRPVGRGAAGRTLRRRNKISWPRAQLLQRLVFSQAELHEKQQETRDDGMDRLSPQDWLVRYIKHLVRITLRRNAFHVTVGLYQLLCDYTTEETMSTYEMLVQDPACFKDDFYYRSRKRRLLAELQERFGSLLKLGRGPRGESRFEPHPKQERFRELVRAGLERFTPWDSPCSMPDRPAGSLQDIPALSFSGEHPDDEHAVEIRRIHALLHPPCQHRLTRLLGLAAVEDRLAVPLFHAADGNGSSPDPPDERQASPLSAREHERAVEQLAENARRRRSRLPSVLLISVDHREKARFATDAPQRICLELEPEAELLEVHTADGLPVAVFLLPSFDRSPATKSCWTVLGPGQKLGLEMRLVDRRQGLPILDVQVIYRPLQARTLFWSRLITGLRHFAVPRRLLPQMLILAFLAGVAYWGLRPPAAPPDTGTDASASGPRELSRGQESRPESLPLAAVRCLHIEVSGPIGLDRKLSAELDRQLDRASFLEPCTRERADALLEVYGDGGDAVSVRLVNRAGEILWQRLDRSLEEVSGLGLIQELEENIAVATAPGDTKSP